jgi:hypothetical protein
VALIRLQEDDDAEGLFGGFAARVIEMVRAGASRREAAEVFSLADSTALQRREKSGSAEAKLVSRRWRCLRW